MAATEHTIVVEHFGLTLQASAKMILSLSKAMFSTLSAEIAGIGEQT